MIPGRLNRLNAVVLERVLPKRAAISVFGRATLAALRAGGPRPPADGAPSE
jgi:hypothetical protein